MVDEMYLQKATQYHSGEYVGADEDGNLYKGIVAFMIGGGQLTFFQQLVNLGSFSTQISFNLRNVK